MYIVIENITMNCELCVKPANVSLHSSETRDNKYPAMQDTKLRKLYEIGDNLYRCIECLYCYGCFKGFDKSDNVNIRYTYLSETECETDYLCDKCNAIPRPAWYYALITEMQDSTCRVQYRKLYNIYYYANDYLSYYPCSLKEYRKNVGCRADPLIEYIDNYTLYT